MAYPVNKSAAAVSIFVVMGGYSTLTLETFLRLRGSSR
jgi:hypothetical protein